MRKSMHAALLIILVETLFLLVFAAEPVFAENFITADEAAVQLRAAMTRRETAVEFDVEVNEYGCINDDSRLGEVGKTLYATLEKIHNAAFEHTGRSNEGDALFYAVYKMQEDAKYTSGDNSRLRMHIKYSFEYYDNAAQEAKTVAYVKKVAKKALRRKGLKNRIKYLYDVTLKRVRYDFSEGSLPSFKVENKTSYSAYGAAIKRRAVCQGYAVLFYRLCTEAGIDCRMVNGLAQGGGHAWNIVKMGSKWYNCDPTWDDNNYTGRKYDYFLCGKNFKLHKVTKKQSQPGSFKAKYPLASGKILVS